MGWNWRTFSFSGCQKTHKGQKLASYPAGNHDYIEHCRVLWLEFHFETYTLNLTSSKLSAALWQQHGDHSGYLDVSCTHLWRSHLCGAVLLPLVVPKGSVWWHLTLLISLSHQLVRFYLYALHWIKPVSQRRFSGPINKYFWKHQLPESFYKIVAIKYLGESWY